MGTPPVQELKNESTNQKENDYGYSKGIEVICVGAGTSHWDIVQVRI